jgi:hypothetical protein
VTQLREAHPLCSSAVALIEELRRFHPFEPVALAQLETFVPPRGNVGKDLPIERHAAGK